MADIVINPAIGKIDFFTTKGDNVTNTLKLSGNTLLVTGPLSASSISTGGGGAFVTSVQPTTNYLSKFTGNSTIANSLIYDNGTNVGIGTTSPGAKLAIIGTRLTDPNNDAQSREIYYAVSRTVASAAGSTTLLGYLTPTGRSDHATIEIYHHDCGTIEYIRYELVSAYYVGTTTDWVQLPTINNISYTGALSGVTVDARLASTAANIELRLRSLGDSCGNMSVYVSIKSNCTFTEQSTTGTGGTVSGLLCNNAYQFPVGANRFEGTTSRGLYITNAGNVGIGTQSPAYRLDVVGTGNFTQLITGTTYPQLTINGTTNQHTYAIINRTNYEAGIQLQTSGTSKWWMYMPSGDDTTLRFYAQNYGDILTIKNTGNVGIGTTNPISKLHVTGSASIPAAVFYGNVGIGTSTFSYPTANRGLLEIYGNSDALIALRGGGSNFYIHKPGLDCYIVNTNSGFISIYNNASERMRIASDGNVGIGTTSPGYKLDVNGTFRSTGDLWTNGNIVISRASANLYINGTNSDAEIVWQANGSNRWAAGMNVGDATENFNIYNYTTSTTNFTILKASGNVGIGTSSPAYKLDVNGILGISGTFFADKSTNYFRILEPAGNIALYLGNASDPTNYYDNTGHTFRNRGGSTTYAYINSNGNLGVGTTGPGYKIDVVGAVRATIDNDFGFVLKRSATNVWTGLGYYTANNSKWFVGLRETGDDNLRWYNYTNSAERMVLTEAGSLGVGTTSPGTKLDVVGEITTPVIKQSTTLYNGSDITDDNSTRTIYFNIPSGGYSPPKYFKVARIKITGNYQNVSLNGYFTTTNSTGLHVGSERKVEFDFIAYAATNPGAPTVTYLKRGPDTTNVLVYAVPNGGGAGTTYYDVYIKSAWYNDTNGELAIRVGYSSAVTIWQAGLDSGTSAPTDTLVNPNSNYSFDTSGNVGIGTTSPAYKLDVYGAVSLRGTRVLTTGFDIFGGLTYDIYGNIRVLRSDSAQADGMYIGYGGSGGPLRFFSNTGVQEFMTIATTGNVGIGSPYPSNRLEVISGSMRVASAAGASEIYFGTLDSANIYLKRDNNYDLSLVQNASSGNALYLAGAGDVYVSIDSNNNETNRAFIVQNNSIKSGTELFRVNEAGSVGIGTSSPGYKLDVGAVGSNNVSVRLTPGYERVRYYGFDLLGYNDGNLWMIGNNTTNALILGSNWDWDAQVAIAYTPGTYGASGGSLEIGQITKNNANFTHGNTRFYTNGVERLRIISSGNVGVGTTTPAAKFQVGTHSTGDAGNGDNSANVRIGAASAGARVYDLTLANTAAATVSNEAALSFVLASNYSATGVISAILRNTSNAYTDLVFTNYNSGLQERMRILYDGNVGIGTTAPAYKLDVSGTGFASSDFRAPIFYDSANTAYYVDPASTSNVNNLTTAGTLYTNNIAKNANGSPIVINSGQNAALGLRVYYDMQLYNSLFFTDSSWNNQGAIFGSGGNVTINAATATTSFIKYAGYSQEGGSFRAPIFYDSDNTSYYVDPASTSNLNILSVTGYQYINGQTLNGQSFYQWEGATYRNPADHTPQLLITKTNSTTGINGFAPALALYNNNGADQTTVGMTFVSAEAVSPTQGNSVELAGIIAKKESTGTAGGWSRGSLNFYTKDFGTRKDVMYMSPDGTVTVTGTDNNSGKSDFSVDTGGTATMALSGQYFRVGSTDVNWAMKMQSNGYLATYGQQFDIATVSGDNAITFATNGVNRVNIGGSTTETVKITGYANYIGNYGYNTLTLIDTSGYPGLNYRSGNNNWLMRMDGGGTYSMNWSSNASAKDVGTFTTPFYFGTGGTAYASNDFRAPIFYDANNTSYYLDPASTSNLNVVNLIGITGAGNAYIQTTSTGTSYTSHFQIREASGGGGNTSEIYAPALGFHWSGVVASNILMESSGRIAIRNNPGSGYENFIAAIVYAGSSVQAPIFYDSNNTAYYVDPASTSNLVGLTVANTITGNISGNSGTATSTTKVASLGSSINYDIDRTTKNSGLCHYSGYSTGTNRPTTYDYTLQVTDGGKGWEISMDWIATTGPAIYARSLRDCCQNWSTWVRILDSVNYSYAYNMNQNVRTTDNVTYNIVDATQFRDSANTSYYLDPASTSVLNYLSLSILNNMNPANSTWHTSAEGKSRFYFATNSTTYFRTGNDFVFRNNSDTGVVVIDASGNLRTTTSGDNSPSYSLHVGGTGYAVNDFRAPIFYDSNNTGYYLDPASTTTSLQIAGAIEQGNDLARPLVQWGVGGDTTGMIIIKLPGTSANYGMIHAVIDIYEYSGANVSTIIVGGHNWNGQWYSYGSNVVGYTNKTVRLGFKDGQYCIVLGGASSVWSYGQVVLRKIQNGAYYTNIMDLGGTYSISQTATESFTWVTGDLTQLRTPGTLIAYGSVQSPIFYDSANTSYYLDPASTSVLYSIAAGVAGNSSANIPALKVTSAGTATTQAAIAIQQQTSEGDTIIFCDFDQYVEWNLVHENSANQLIVHGGASTNNLGSNTFYSPNGTAKTGYIKHVFDMTDGNTYLGGSVGIGTTVPAQKLDVRGIIISNTDVRAPIFYDSNNTSYYFDGDAATSLNIAGQITTAKTNGTLLSIAGADTIGYNSTAGRGAYIKGTSTTYVYGSGVYYDGSNIRQMLYEDTWLNNKYFGSDGIIYSAVSMRAPIFYDSDDTTYYLDAASTSLSLKTRSSIVINNASSPQNLAMLNIGYNGAGETRAIDIYGSWSGGENKSISFTHGSTASDIVAQINGQHNGPGSKLRFGKLYHSGNSSTYTMELISESTTSAYLTVAGSVRSPVFYDSADTGYFVDPNGTSNLYYITMPYLGNGTPNLLVNSGGSENWSAIKVSGGNDQNGIGYSNTGHSAFGRNNFSFHVHSSDAVRFQSSGWDTLFEVAGFSGNAWLKGGLFDSGFTRLVNPGGAYYVTSTSTVTGAIKIRLPRWKVNTMMRMTVKIYQYNTGYCTTIECGGYDYSNADWYNVFAYQNGDLFGNITVRFGNDGTYDCIWIGETTDTWSYPQVFVTDFQAGFSNYGEAWGTGWNISYVTSFGTVSTSRVAYKTLNTNSTLTAGNLSGTIPSAVLGNSTVYIGTTAIALNRASSSQTLTGISIDGNAATATVNSGNTSASWYPIVWHSGNTHYSTSNVQIYAAGGYIQANYFNSSDNDETSITRFIIKNGDNYHRSATTTTAADIIRGVASGTWSINVTGNAATATNAVNLSTTRSNWSTNGTITAVVGQLCWKNYGNGHTIIDASNSTSPAGSAIGNTNPDVAWTGTYPTLMGWNGTNTYGVRVDSCRYADQVGYSPSRTDSTAYPVLWGSGTSYTVAYSCAAVTIQSSTGTLNATNVNISGKLVQNSTTQSITGTGQTLTLNVAAAAVQVISMASGATITTISYTNRDNNPSVNTIMLVVKYAGTASITFTNVLWANGTAPTLTGTNGYADVFMLTSYQGGAGTPVWIGTVVSQALVSTNL